jgi:hypothetical protein
MENQIQSSHLKKLLFITQRLDEQDHDLAFVIHWVDAFRAAGYEVQVICLKLGVFDGHFPVYSLGKEKKRPKWRWVLEFYKLIFTLRYDRVFVHMNTEWSALGGWYWWLTRRPFYLWYTHYTMTWHLRVTSWLVTKMFCATVQSLPQFTESEKKSVVGHGIDLPFWTAGKIGEPAQRDRFSLLTVHRISRSSCSPGWRSGWAACTTDSRARTAPSPPTTPTNPNPTTLSRK